MSALDHHDLRSRRYDLRVTTRDRLHQFVDDLNETEVEAALTRLRREREALDRWADEGNADTVLDEWSLANAREAIREEPW